MPPIATVRVWYGDGAVRDGWEKTPRQNVQVVAWLHDGGGVTWAHGVDTYTLPGSSHVKHGKTIPDTTYAAILTEARASLAGV
jgi:hypothetical protein